MSTRINETCSCGAQFNVVSSIAGSLAAEWRQRHQHTETVGICGHPLSLSEGVKLTCNLKAGHEGWHSDGQSHWNDRSPDPDPWADQLECTPCADGRHAYCAQSPSCECFTNPGVHGGESGGSTL